jgi:RNA polymerase sigma factor (sigma-70 family)
MRFTKQHIRSVSVKSGIDSIVSAASKPSSVQLWKQFINGSQSAFEQIYYKHVNLLYDYGVRLSKDAQLAEDCIQDLFSDLWEKRSDLPQVAAVKSFLLVALKRRIYRMLANRKNSQQKINQASEVILTGFDPYLDEQVHEANIIALKKAFKNLSDRQKEVIYLRFYNQLSYSEIAEIMDVQVKAIYKLTARALQSLRNNITDPIFSNFIIILLSQ